LRTAKTAVSAMKDFCPAVKHNGVTAKFQLQTILSYYI